MINVSNTTAHDLPGSDVLPCAMPQRCGIYISVGEKKVAKRKFQEPFEITHMNTNTMHVHCTIESSGVHTYLYLHVVE